jgi:hypothetical protein
MRGWCGSAHIVLRSCWTVTGPEEICGVGMLSSATDLRSVERARLAFLDDADNVDVVTLTMYVGPDSELRRKLWLFPSM